MGSITALIVKLINRLRAGRGGGGGGSYRGGGGRSYRGSGSRGGRPKMSPEESALKAAQDYAFKASLNETYKPPSEGFGGSPYPTIDPQIVPALENAFETGDLGPIGRTLIIPGKK
jgi:hypothetical protein